MRARGLLGNTSTEIATAGIMLTVLCGSALAFLGYLPENGSFQVKLAVANRAQAAAIAVREKLIDNKDL